jgi:hypothetical protein
MRPLNCILLLLCLLTGPTVYSRGPADKDTITIGDITFRITLITKVEFDTVEVLPCPEDSNKKVREYKDSLCFKLLNGKRFILYNSKATDNEDGYDGEFYYYDCELKSIGQWVVGHSSFENYNYLLVDEQDGSVTELKGFCCKPVLSPDQKQLVCGSDFGNIAGINGIYFFDVDHKKVEPHAERTLPDWGFSDLKWVDDSTLVAQLFDGNRLSYIKLTRSW